MPIQFFLEDAHPEHAVKIEGLIRGLLAQFPWVPLKRVEIYQPADDDDHSMANADQDGVISFNAYWFAQPPEVLDQAAKTNYLVPIAGELVAWHGDMVSEPLHVIAHEFAHVMSQALPGWRREVEARRLEATRDPGEAVSGYGLAGPDEYFAEEIADALLDGREIFTGDAEFKEAQHPRGAKGGGKGGQFVKKGEEGGGGGGGGGAVPEPPQIKSTQPANLGKQNN